MTDTARIVEGRCERCDAKITHRHGNLCAACIADDMDYVEEVNGRHEFDEFDDCGLMPDGQCLKAGSEECDWECGRLNFTPTTGGGDA